MRKTESAADRVLVQNIVSPGRTYSVDARKYEVMKTALLKVIPKNAPGFTYAQIKAALTAVLSEEYFPGGAKVGWWLKCVQLDLEAKGLLVRDVRARPLRWHLQLTPCN